MFRQRKVQVYSEHEMAFGLITLKTLACTPLRHSFPPKRCHVETLDRSPVLTQTLCCLPLPPEGPVVSSLVPGMPAVPKPWLSTGASTGFSCQVSPNRFKAASRRQRTAEKKQERNVSVKTRLRTKHLPQGCQTSVLEARRTAELSFLSTSFNTLDSTRKLIPTASHHGLNLLCQKANAGPCRTESLQKFGSPGLHQQIW